jgi:chromatin segregation and condensation protein Rec8/ScpA/Scc1 (kleisin family)
MRSELAELERKEEEEEEEEEEDHDIRDQLLENLEAVRARYSAAELASFSTVDVD